METTILVIPSEGNSPDTEQWYIKKLKERYGKELNVIVFEPSQNPNICQGVHESVDHFLRSYGQSWPATSQNHKESKIQKLEIHAQAGIGSFTAFTLYNHPLAHAYIERIFFIGGAPRQAMTKPAFLLHRYLSWIWYFSPIPFFAGNLNPTRSFEMECIRKRSTTCMRQHPRLYRNQLVHLSNWTLPKDWYRWATDPDCFFVPNGASERSFRLDRTYDNERAIEIWSDHGVMITKPPEDNFSMYNLSPANALFDVMDHERQLT